MMDLVRRAKTTGLLFLVRQLQLLFNRQYKLQVCMTLYAYACSHRKVHVYNWMCKVILKAMQLCKGINHNAQW